MEKLNGTSMDIVQDNVEKLKQIFPEIISEGKIDFEVLQQLLGKEIDVEQERYSFNWHGKSNARRIAQEPSTGTLLPSKEDSKNWDNTDNLYIEGDNLEVLKLLQKSYHNKVKMIYIDPPYNTGKDFVYPDNFKDNLKNYLEITGQTGEEGQKLSTNSDSNGRYHSDWLNMMYPRLKLARNLLTDDGVIFISIDDNEQSNLKKLCDEIFGEENFIKLLPTVMNLKGNNDEFGFAGTHEYTLTYVKNKNSIEDLGGIRLEKNDKKEYNLKDEIGFYKKGATLMRTGEDGIRHRRPKGYYPIYVTNDYKEMSLEKRSNTDIEVFPKTKDGIEMSWRRSKETLEKTLNEFIIVNSSTGVSFYKKQRLEEVEEKGKKAKSLFYKPEYSSGNGTALMKSLFENKIFNNPKPLELIKDFILIGLEKNDIILDFFSGSGGMFVQSMKFVERHHGNKLKVSIVGQEKNPDTRRLAKMNLAIRGIAYDLGEKAVGESSTFTDDQHLNRKVDYIMANPPFNLKDWRGDNELLTDPRWHGYETPPKSNANYAWILHMLSKLDVTNGVAGFLLANGALNSDGVEYEIRKKLIENDKIEAIIVLPRDMFYTTDISVTLWIINNNKKARTLNNRQVKDRTNEILFVDLRTWDENIAEYDISKRSKKRKTVLTDEQIDRIKNLYFSWQTSQGYDDIPELCKSASLKEIREANYSLAPSKYVEFIDRDLDIDYEKEMVRIQTEMKYIMKLEKESQKSLEDAFRGIGYEI